MCAHSIGKSSTNIEQTLELMKDYWIEEVERIELSTMLLNEIGENYQFMMKERKGKMRGSFIEVYQLV